MTDIEIDEHEFKKLPQSDQNWIVLKTFQKQTQECEGRFCEIEGDVRFFKWVHTAAAGFGGVIGGIIAVIGHALFIKQ